MDPKKIDVADESELSNRMGRLGARKPPAVYVWGEWPASPIVAVVGTRRVTESAAGYTRQLCRYLAEAGVAVISGGAAGVDRAAHEGALEGEGRGAVVAPTWLQNPYPRQHQPLYEKILGDGGAYLTPTLDPEQAPHPGLFFARNAVMAAAADALVIVQASHRSGARNAARWARVAGTPVFAVPASPWDSAGAGCLEEIRLGATPLLRNRDLLSHVLFPRADIPLKAEAPPRELGSARGLGANRVKAKGKNTRIRPGAGRLTPEGASSETGKALESEQECILSAIGSEPTAVSKICDITGIDPAKLQPHLLTLTLRGVLVCTHCGRYRLAVH